MKSARADALRLILPLLLRMATVDLFGTGDFRDLVDVLLGFDDVLFAEDRTRTIAPVRFSGPRLSVA